MVMPGNHSGAIMHYWAGRFPGRVGWLIGPRALPKTKLRSWMPFALDNDAFTAWVSGKPWDEAAWRQMLLAVSASGLKPRWVLVPDVVADRVATLEKWKVFAPVAAEYRWPLAMAVQDGMMPNDVPIEADVIFIGGTTEWKWRSLPMWVGAGRRIHVGRVNELERLFICERFGVESVDGTGWFRETSEGRQARALTQYLERTAYPHPDLFAA